MSVKYDVLAALQKTMNTPVSGQELAEALGVTRNSVWKAINSLRQDGYHIEAVTNSGYTLTEAGDVLSAQSVEKYLNTENLSVHVYQTVDSTNTALKSWAAKGSPEGTVLIAEQQTAGKGRLGRGFVSPEMGGLYMSILLRPGFPAEEALTITTAAAVAVAEAVEELSGRKAQIKWVNDVYLEGKKICGILTEASMNFENGGLEYAVLGIGINLREPEAGYPQELREIITAVFQENPPDEIRSKMAARVLDRFFAIYGTLPGRAYIGGYRSRSYLTGKKVTLVTGNREESGTVLDIDDQARLVVLLESGKTEAFSAGEANLKKK